MLMTVEKMEKCQSLAIVLDEKKNLTEYKLMENYQSKIDFILCWCAVIKSIWMLKMNKFILSFVLHFSSEPPDDWPSCLGHSGLLYYKQCTAGELGA